MVPNYTDLSQENNKCPRYLASAILILVTLSVLGCGVSIVVLSIKGLVVDWDTVQCCKQSNLHIYMIMSLVLDYVSAANINKALISIVISASLMSWGVVEVFDKACDALIHTLLWNMGIVTICLQAFIVILGIVSLCFRIISYWFFYFIFQV